MNRLFRNPSVLVLILIMAYQAITNNQYNSPMEWLMETVTLLPGVVIGLSFHEFAHAKVANLCGDPTPKLQGRVTINPAAHIDPVGFLALFIIQFGWGKPVMIDSRNFRNPRRDELFVAFAGVTMNLLLAILFTGFIRLLYVIWPDYMTSPMGVILGDVLFQVVVINIVLMVFNLLPVPPLDGFNIVTQIFNLRNSHFYYQVYDKGFLLLMVLIMLNVTGKILTPAVSFIFNTLVTIFF